MNWIREEFAGLRPTYTSVESPEELHLGITAALGAKVNQFKMEKCRGKCTKVSLSPRQERTGCLMSAKATDLVVAFQGAATTVQSLPQTGQ
ncbi:hypothetical protein Trydic_g22406 [Trypoxylus dichotomus]